MQYTRDFIPLKECTSGYGRGGMIPHGIARMERHEDAVKLRINIYGLAPGAGPYAAYAISVGDSTYRRINLGQLQPDLLGRCELGYRATAQEVDSQRIQVVAVALTDGTEVMTGYVDGAVDWKSLRDADAEPAVQDALAVKAKEAEPAVAAEEVEPTAVAELAETPATEGETVGEELTEEVPLTETDTLRQEAEAAEPLMRHAALQEEDTVPITSQAAAKDALQYMFQAYPRIYPFRNTETRWIRIHPRDIAPLPTDVITLENSPFLQRGYLQFKHLVLGYDGEVYYLGVPFRYHQEQEEIAHNWGFREFRNSFGTVPMKGDYGYWIMSVRFQEEGAA